MTGMSVVEGRGHAKGEIGMAYIDLYHPELGLVQFSDTAAYSKLRIKLQAINPVELILPDTAVEKGGNMLALFYCLQDEFRHMQITPVSRKMFNECRGIGTINRLKTADCTTVEKDMNGKYYCLSCAAALIEYVEHIQNIIFAPKSVRVKYRGTEKTMLLDPSTAKSLELIISQYGEKNTETSLFGVLNFTCTTGGARMLRSSILQPSADIELIRKRHDAIEEISGCSDGFTILRSLISRMLDVDQLVSLCAHLNKEETERAADYKITQVIYLKHTLELVEPLKYALDRYNSEMLISLRELLHDDRFQSISNQISATLNDEITYQKGALKMRNQKCFAVKSNLNGLLDISRRTYSELVNDVQELTLDIVSDYNLPLRCGYSSGRGFYLQLNLREVQDIQEFPAILMNVVQRDRINEVVSEILSMSNIIVTDLLATIRDSITCLYNLTEVISSLDMLLSLVTVSQRFLWIRPEFTDSIAIQQGRHPIMERFTNHVFVPNDVYAGPDSNFIIVTGPNMGGKSTYLKMIAVLQVMTQIGSFVPANYASFRLCDQLFSRIEHNDNPEANCSSFVVEMKDMNYILKNVTSSSLVIIDELGRSVRIPGYSLFGSGSFGYPVSYCGKVAEDMNEDLNSPSGSDYDSENVGVSRLTCNLLKRLQTTVSGLRQLHDGPLKENTANGLPDSYRTYTGIGQLFFIQLDIFRSSIPALDEMAQSVLTSYSLKEYLRLLSDGKQSEPVCCLYSFCSNLFLNLVRIKDFTVYFHDGIFDSLRSVMNHVALKIGREKLTEHRIIICLSPSLPHVELFNTLLLQFLPYVELVSVPAQHSAPNATYSSCMDVEELQKLLYDKTRDGLCHIVVVAVVGSQTSGENDSISKLIQLREKYAFWLHAVGSNLIDLVSSAPNEELYNSVQRCESFTLSLDRALGVPSVPYIVTTLCRTVTSFAPPEKLNAVPWCVVFDRLETQRIRGRIDVCFELSCEVLAIIANLPELNLVSYGSGMRYLERVKAKTVSRPLTLIFEYCPNLPQNNGTGDELDDFDALKNSSYMKALNAWFGNFLSLQCPSFGFKTVEISCSETALQFSPIELRSMGVESLDLTHFDDRLRNAVKILNATLRARMKFEASVRQYPQLKSVAIEEWAGVGCFVYVPEILRDCEQWNENQKIHASYINMEIIHDLKKADHAFSLAKFNNGEVCIKCGMISDANDLPSLIEAVVCTGEKIEKSSTYMDALAERVKQGIELASQELKKESEFKLLNMGLIRKVPVVKSIINWWSPLPENSVRGRYFDLKTG
ncbi:unnamed protein product [Soboliphyme baturini]|uniref:Pyridoxal-dependent decarboxylase domain-containing protein 1 n=1 Tax=Soboliphyme baturini TaxID=241478 RepID=A0A183IBQ8_9BILA|nr:unnamed protein product [Soboliphyme baturini]